jgi:hypothetical protein
MAEKANVPVPFVGALYYRMPESDHTSLGHVRDELGLLADLAMRDCCDNEETVHLSPTALAQCFARLSVVIGEIMENCVGPSESGVGVKQSRH